MIKIHKHDWEKYLEREQPLFLFASIDDPYGEMLKKATGFGFSKQLYYFRGKIGVFYKLKKELSEADSHYAGLIAKKDPRIETWIQKEKASHELAKSLTTDMPLKEIVSKFQEILLYNTTIPFRLLSASKKVKPDKKLFEQLEKIRLHSLYPNILDIFLPKVFKKLSQKSGIPKGLLFLCTPEELISIDQGSKTISESDLKLRMKGCYFIKDKEWKFIQSPIDKYAVVSSRNELKGSIAFRGSAKGKVKIINKTADMPKFSKGDVLVSINTNPSLMPVIKISNAIVTDEGGITCHASIVARELKKPCIIGTKDATKVLKDGDLVEVDANKGVVRILKKNKG